MSDSAGKSRKKSNIADSSKIVDKLVQHARKKICFKTKKTRTTKAKNTKKESNNTKGSIAKSQTKLKQEIASEETDSTPISPSSSDQNFIIPHITKKNWDKFENTITQKDIDEITKKLNTCLARMHSHEVYDTHFTSLHFIRLAIVDSVINRKWNNLLKLVIRLGRNYSDPIFKMFIRHLCQILKRYHPAIRGTEFEDQIDLIVEKHDRKRDR